ncbi:hypothetical protein M0R88_12395 [Halorussus gelatinilyticus]|uniref:Uncharacterized protein n=1 Tax=Halorussus gelatinilyticus TaxID=2937524 RepID=A0A8U0IF47_9EURY|nr:hypothetical protein [Halorussus gelatinilyticus]UPV99320.1 hypothetical protein M0R88_12395 [Halorussus gelatinilyticus]
MTGVAKLLASVPASAPVQRVRNYHLTDRAASPRPRDFLTAARRTDGAVCLRWTDAAGERFVRYAGPDWECAEFDRHRDRKRVETCGDERVLDLLGDARPELVAAADVPGVFAERDAHAAPETGFGVGETSPTPDAVATDGGSEPNAEDGPLTAERVRIERYADLLADPAVDRHDADALAAALPTGPREVAFGLPLVLAEETVLESVAGSDRVIVAELVPERETERAYYVRQDRRGCWVSKAAATVYKLADGATLDADRPESAESA